MVDTRKIQEKEAKRKLVDPKLAGFDYQIATLLGSNRHYMSQFDGKEHNAKAVNKMVLFAEGPFPLSDRDDDNDAELEFDSVDSNSNSESSNVYQSLYDVIKGVDKLKLDDTVTPFKRFGDRCKVKCYAFGIARRSHFPLGFNYDSMESGYYFRFFDDEDHDEDDEFYMADARRGLLGILSDIYEMEYVDTSLINDNDTLSKLPSVQKMQSYEKIEELHPVFQKYYSPLKTLQKYKFALGLDSRRVNVRKVIENLLNISEHNGGNLDGEFDGYATEYRNETHSVFVVTSFDMRDDLLQRVLHKAVSAKIDDPQEEGDVFDESTVLFIPGHVTYKKCEN